MMNRIFARSSCVFPLAVCLLAGMMFPGCSSSTTDSTSDQAEAKETQATAGNGVATQEAASDSTEASFEPPVFEADAEKLLASRLPIERTEQGWIRLFDGHTLFGWAIGGKANFRVEDETIVADQGENCLLTTSTQWSDYELELQFQCDEDTNSGVFVRTTLDPQDVTADCYEVNIAPPSNPFPTGGVVERAKGETFDTDPEKWHTMNILCDGATLRVTIDGTVTCEIDDATRPTTGYIGLQHRDGRIAFKNIQLRPLGLKNLLADGLEGWTVREGMEGEYRINDDGHLVVDGGKQQLETNAVFGDFVMLADYKMDDPKSNSGLFFRAIPGDEMMGYECQVSNELVDGNPLKPADCGAGGIFRRQDARVVAGEPERWNSILLVAEGNHFATWVNGIQVTDIVDTRKADENPRRGLRLEPGSIIVQGHDKTTQATYRQIAVVDQAAAEGSE
ncbi:3-keto-disaccharide hydrolase [Rhodopirellula sp. P2]|uniref:3-keto-disaccharide hydrolase n=1 Tax=Rhodopirellula sp. P2 TaxID=2127060 RepID=UPI0023684F64|nr:DUF1080 domain-containing protein [Rhodopirellula sp. P2]WDQ18725.1 DUF1080 domain-containing protein [Rhodopirellula sp. P2]